MELDEDTGLRHTLEIRGKLVNGIHVAESDRIGETEGRTGAILADLLGQLLWNYTSKRFTGPVNPVTGSNVDTGPVN